MLLRNLITTFVTILLLVSLVQAQDLIKQEYFENGKLKSTLYQDGNSYRYVTFYDSGKIMEQGRFTKGKRNGKFESWYENGSPHVSVSFAQNNKDGLCTIWNEDKQVIFQAKFQRGKLIRGFMWDDSGKLIAAR